jgi:ABC-type polysaccharide/polyol phosphate transport system ATPase subunit
LKIKFLREYKLDKAIELKNISKIFRVKLNSKIQSQNKLVALSDVSLSISKGETVALLGLNGSGKTTLLRIISGIYKPDSGSIDVRGRLAPLLQIGIGFNPELDAIDNIRMYGMLLGFSKKEIESKIDDILDFAELHKFSKMKIKNFSTGMKARLGFATAFQINPDILLVDEVLAVGDENFRQKSFKEFIKFKEKGKTIVFTTHNLNWILKLADKAILLTEGKISEIGTPKDVLETYRNLIKNISDKT